MSDLRLVAQIIIESLSKEMNSDARRLFHGRGHQYENLDYINVDWFKSLVLITLYREVESNLWNQFVDLIQVIDVDAESVIVQHRYRPGAPIDLLWGQIPEQCHARENTLKYDLSIGGKQNIGFFLDMEPGRRWLNERALGKRILNLFSYTCSFSVAAIEGGASTVMNVDMSKAALNVGRKNHQLNNHQEKLKRDIQFLPYNIFRSWKRIVSNGPYDIVVVDPPSRQKGSFIANKDYVRVLKRIPTLLAEGGELLLCLNAPELGEDFLTNLVANELPDVSFVKRLDNRVDLPEVNLQRSLKMLHYQL